MNRVADLFTTWGVDILFANHDNKYVVATGYAFLRVARWLYR